MLTELIDSLGLLSPWTWVVLFLGSSLLMLWRLEALLDHGLEGTALGTLMTPYCSGLGNLLFVLIMVQHGGAPSEVFANCLVNNLTNLTLLLGLPALLWGLQVIPIKSGPKKNAKAAAKSKVSAAATGAQVNRLSLLLTLTAVFFFTGGTWLLATDGKLDRTDGLILVGAFLFWQTFQVYDVMKHNVKRRVSFGWKFYADGLAVLLCAWVQYESIDWLVTWISSQKGDFINASHLGWLSGWLMVVPNGLLAFYWAWKRRADVVYTSQVGDGHISIPLCVGLYALLLPAKVPADFSRGLLLLLGATLAHAVFLMIRGGLPRWAGALFAAAYGWYVWDGLG